MTYTKNKEKGVVGMKFEEVKEIQLKYGLSFSDQDKDNLAVCIKDNGVYVRYFTGTSFGSWVYFFYPSHMIKMIQLSYIEYYEA